MGGCRCRCVWGEGGRGVRGSRVHAHPKRHSQTPHTQFRVLPSSRDRKQDLPITPPKRYQTTGATKLLALPSYWRYQTTGATKLLALPNYWLYQTTGATTILVRKIYATKHVQSATCNQQSCNQQSCTSTACFLPGEAPWTIPYILRRDQTKLTTGRTGSPAIGCYCTARVLSSAARGSADANRALHPSSGRARPTRHAASKRGRR